MKRTFTIVVLAAVMASFAGAAMAAGTATPRIDRREARQQHRITQGVRSGALTPRETARLDAGQAHVERMEARAKADGRVTAGERGRITRAQNRQSRAIYRKKHNVRTS
jgi:uncharacterized membrane protein YebE (DUF533 family)